MFAALARSLLGGLRQRVVASSRKRCEKHRYRPCVEELENRTTPTIVFTPQFGPDVLASSPPYTSVTNGVMSSATVYLILWGPTWSLKPNTNQSNANTIIDETKAFIGSGSLDVLKQYGSDGLATLGGYYIDNSTPPPDFLVGTGHGLAGTSATEAENEIASVISEGHLPGPSGIPSYASAPVYVIVTDPDDSYGSPGVTTSGGVNRPGQLPSTAGVFADDRINMIGVGTHLALGLRNFSLTFSHELIEKMSDPAGIPSFSRLASLTTALGANDPSPEIIHVSSAAPFASSVGGYIGINFSSEKLRLLRIDTVNNTLLVQRGADGTLEAAHSIGTAVFSYSAPDPQAPPPGWGVIATPPPGIPPYAKVTPGDPVTAHDNWNQIADFEPEQPFRLKNGHSGVAYVYRLGGANGIEVQAVYSAVDKAFVVEDGNSEAFNLRPDWTIASNANGDYFDGTYDLTINGDQLSNKDDTITISKDSAGGIQVDLNGEIASFGPGTSTTVGTAIRSITINGRTGDNRVDLDFSNGNFLSVMNPNGDPLPGLITINGAGTTSLVLQGGTFPSDAIKAAASGTIALDGSLLRFSNLSSIVDTTRASNFVIAGTGAVGETIDVGDDPAGTENGFAAGEVRGNDFTRIDFANKTNVVVNAGPTLAAAESGTFVDDLTAVAAFLNTVTLNGAANASSVIFVQATPAQVTTNVVGHRASRVYLGEAGGTQGIEGAVNIEGGTPGNSINVDDSADASDRSATLSYFTPLTDAAHPDGNNPDAFGAIHGLAPGAIDFELAGTARVNLEGGEGDNTLVGPDLNTVWMISGFHSGSMNAYQVQNFPSSTVFTFSSFAHVNGGGYRDVFFIAADGSAASIDGGGGANEIDGPNRDTIWTITGYHAGFVAGFLGSFANIQSLVGGAGNDVFVFGVAGIMATIDGKAGNNTIVGPDRNNTWYITGTNAGAIAGVLGSFTDVQNLVGGSMQDVFIFFPGGALAGEIVGAAGPNWLVYSQLYVSIRVNLAVGTASLVCAGVRDIENVLGSAKGGDCIRGAAAGGILVGHASGNSIIAGNGRSLIIGGNGKSKLLAETAGDIVIHPAPAYDVNITVLASLLNVWDGGASSAAQFSYVSISERDAG